MFGLTYLSSVIPTLISKSDLTFSSLLVNSDAMAGVQTWLSKLEY